jgi:5-methylcytosine-specific restriction protein A
MGLSTSTAREPRLSAYARGYTKRWDRAAKAFRVRYPLCGMRPCGQVPVMSQCFLEQRDTPGTHTDHVVPQRGNEARFWDVEGNWQSLCTECHSRKTQAGL